MLVVQCRCGCRVGSNRAVAVLPLLRVGNREHLVLKEVILHVQLVQRRPLPIRNRERALIGDAVRMDDQPAELL